MRLGRFLVAGIGVVAVVALTVLAGAAATGQAADPQKVTASLACTPETAKTTVGCALTITNVGGNNVTKVEVTVTATGGTFLSSTDSRCTPSASTLTCRIPKMSSGAIVVETHELQLTASATQTVAGRYSPNPNSRGSDTVLVTSPNPVTTTQNTSNDFDGLFANNSADDAQTGTTLSGSNPYSTNATLTGSFTVGLTVLEHGAGTGNPNCPATGCFGGQVIEFEITPLPNTAFPDLYTLLIEIADAAIANNVQENELDVRHDGVAVPLCTDDISPEDQPCIVDRDIASGNPKDATIIVSGPGDQNGSWGVG
jgi:hypothetical protein